MNLRSQLPAALRVVIVLTVLCGLAYPLLVTGVAQVGFGDRAGGSLIERDGRVVGSRLLGQSFVGDTWFQPRPSAAGASAQGAFVEAADTGGRPVPADPADLSLAASGASNQGPTNPDLLVAVGARAEAYRALNGLDPGAEVPIDAVTASASGLDPQISVANARLQAPRVARERGLDLDVVLGLVDRHTAGPSLGFLGERGVNVLELNLALDDLG